MAFLSLRLPQISRFISANAVSRGLFWTQRTLLWSALVTLFVTNIYTNTRLTRMQANVFLPIYQAPFAAASHTTVALTLWRLGRETQAKQELKLAENLFLPEKNTVLGATTDPQTILKSWESEPLKRKDAITFWQQVVREKSDYRDAFLVLGGLLYQDGQTIRARKAWESAKKIDPNNAQVNAFLSSLK